MNTHDDTDGRADRELHEAVRSYGESVQPSNRLGAIRARTRETTAGASARAAWWRRSWLLAGGVGLVAASVVAVAVALAPSDAPTGGGTPVAEGSQGKATVYYLSGMGDRGLLAPEQVAADDTGDPGLDAARALVSTQPRDPDYANGFDFLVKRDPITQVSAVTESGGVTTVNFDEDPWNPYSNVAFENGPSGAIIIQQLVWTVQDALDSDAPVAFTVNGEPARGIWMQPTRRPVQADPAALAPIIIDYPTDGSTVQVSRRITVSGTSDTFEANVAWEVLKGNRVVQNGATMGGTMGERAKFRFDLQLAPGTYTIRAYAQSAEDGSLVAEDTKAITVE